MEGPAQGCKTQRTPATSMRTRLPLAGVRVSIRHPRTVLACWFALCALATPGLRALRVDTSTDSVLDRWSEDWAFYQHSQALFGGDEIITVALQGREPFDPQALAQIERLTRRFEQLEDVRRVDSLASVPVVRASADGTLELQPALAGAPLEPEALSHHVAQRLRGDRIAPRSLISPDGRTLAINLVLERGVEGHHADLLARLHEAVDAAGGILSGVPVFRVAANERTRSELLLFAPLTGILIASFLLFVFRSVAAVAVCTAPGVVGCWLFMAAMGAFGAPMSITTMALPSIILALGCAYAMHVLVAASGARTPHELEEKLRPVTLPVALSGLTTAIGFIAIAVVHIDAVRFTGVYGALGVLAVTTLSLTALPGALALRPLPVPVPRGSIWLQRRGAALLLGVAMRRRPRRLVLAAWTGLALLFTLGLGQIEIETDATRWLPPGDPVRDSYETIRRELSGISPMNVVIESREGESVLEPATLAAIDGLGRHLESLPAVGKAISLADPLRQIHGGFKGDPSQPLPAGRALAEQYLLLLDSLDSLADLVTADRTAANVLLRVDNNGSGRLVSVAREAERWWRAHGSPQQTARATGIMYEFARAEDEIALGQLRGLSVALFVIAALLFTIFRWPRLAGTALVPNLIPLVVIFGSMGLMGIPLDAGTVLVGSLALGVAVDDTVHLATGFHRRLVAGASAAAALGDTLESVLPAVLYTTLMISSAFFVLGLSDFSMTRNLGLLTGAIMILCLAADITLLPALLLRLRITPASHADQPNRESAS